MASVSGNNDEDASAAPLSELPATLPTTPPLPVHHSSRDHHPHIKTRLGQYRPKATRENDEDAPPNAPAVPLGPPPAPLPATPTSSTRRSQDRSPRGDKPGVGQRRPIATGENIGEAHTPDEDAPPNPPAVPLGPPPAPLPATPTSSARRSQDRSPRGDKPGVGHRRPIATGDMYIGMIDDLPQGVPLEKPLHPKRRRTLVFDDYETKSWSSMSSGTSSQVLAKAESSWSSMSSGTSSQVLAKAESSLSSMSSLTSSRPPVLVKPEPSSSSMSSRSPSQPPVLAKPKPSSSSMSSRSSASRSPVLAKPKPVKKCETPRKRKLQQSLRDADSGCNLGSEEEDGDSGDEDESPQVLVPRFLRMFVEEEDAAPEAEAAIVLDPLRLNVMVEGEMNETNVEGEINVEGETKEMNVKDEINEMNVEGEMNEMNLEGEMNEMNVEGEMNEMNVEDEMNESVFHFEFDWREFSNPPISPELRREVFVGCHGPTTEPTLSPYDTFVKIWDRPVMEEIAWQTNIYAQQYAARLLDSGLMTPNSRIVEWRDTDADELYTYFALVMAMGITVKSTLVDYWSTDNNIFSTPGFSTNMSLRRFQLLAKCLHFTDNTDCPPNRTRSEAKISKIKPIVDHLNAKFQALYSLGQNIALDESLTQWKGWLDIKQYIPNKTSKVGIKTYEVCDSVTGYLWRFEIHSGGESNKEAIISGSIPNLVLRLLQGLDNRGHTVWMDNYYNSPALARILKMMGFDCVGTLRTNQQFVPEQLTNLKKSDMLVGQVCGYTSGDVDVMVWRDLNRVGLISTYHGIAVRDSKPILIKDYNVCMGGVDKKDQMLAMYLVERKRTQVWYKKFFKRLLNASILNAYIIHKHHHTLTTHRAFRMELVNQLLQRHQLRETAPLVTGARGIPKFSAEVRAHFPVELPNCSGDKHNRPRRLCVVCKKKRTPIQCKACNVSLCFDLKSSSCFLMYHT